ncbi:Ras GTPase-activating protein-binding protein 2 [Toxocara canis]|uniref:Ras GTPase-activating protein-binding protein 2 n=1 Tax=Toxocara canis TaxID=6265 RepID=A0A0B2V3H9_TOXCA|nr:Ras GTPase-activating protein-binding protein 2 [Toxocara canis]
MQESRDRAASMKMEGVSEMVNGRNELQKQPQPSPKEIGREFVRQYYTMLSERPQDVFRFYSHESYFVHDIDQPVQGQQVCGELSMNEQPGRRFLQTFVLCPQTPKKYYVHNDVFQWLDRAFVDLVPHTQQQQNAGEAAQSEAEERSMANGEVQPTVNGHQQMPTDAAVHRVHLDHLDVDGELKAFALTESSVAPEGAIDAEGKKCDSEVVNEPVEEQQQATEQDMHSEHEPSPEKHDERCDNETPVQPSEQAPEQQRAAAVVDTGPKTWAKLVSGSSTPSVPVSVTQASARQPQQQQQQPMRASAPPSQPASASMQPPPSINTQPPMHQSNESEMYGTTTGNYGGSRFGGEDGCRLYIGGITRNIVPEGTAVVEKEIRNAFEKFGPVASVNVPRRVLDAPETQRSVYAFVVMKTLEGAKAAFSVCRKDRGMSFLPLKIDSFGFEGEATLSEQKGAQGGGSRGAQFPHRGPPMQGMQRGSYGMRGGAGGGRGGGRGVHPRAYGTGGSGEYRHAGVAGAHP